MAKIYTSAKRNRLQGLKALRDKLSKELDECKNARYIPALSKQLRDTLEEIEKIEDDAAVVIDINQPKNALELIRAKHKKEA